MAKRATNIGASSSRYAPELDIGLDIYDVGEWLCRSQSFYTKITVSLTRLGSAIEDLTREWKDQEQQRILSEARKSVALFQEHLIDAGNSAISWNSVGHLLEELEKTIDPLFSYRSPARVPTNSQENEADRYPSVLRSWAHHLLSHIREVQSLLQESRTRATNQRLLLMKGRAGVGKTHGLCAMTEAMAMQNIPVVMVFANQFESRRPILPQVPAVLGVRQRFRSTKILFKALNEFAKNKGVRALVIIDGLNESPSPTRTRRAVTELLRVLEEFSHVALLISIRSDLELYYLPANLESNAPTIEHVGFDNKEWEAVKKYFLFYSLPLPEVPVLHAEFRNPLFLSLFCETVSSRVHSRKRESQAAFRGEHSMVDILEDYFILVGNRVLKSLGLPRGRTKGEHLIWDKIVKNIAASITSSRGNVRFVTQRELLRIVRQSEIHVAPKKIISTLVHSGVLARFPTGTSSRETFNYYFTYERFGSYLLCRYLLKGISLSDPTLKNKVFSKQGKIGRILAKGYEFALTDALSCCIPERSNGFELIEFCPWAKDLHHVQQAFLDSLVWRKPSSFRRDTEGHAVAAGDYLNHINREGSFGPWRILETIITTSPVPDHPFNAQLLDTYLRRMKMPERDAHWSAHINVLASEDGSVERLLSWTLTHKHRGSSDDEKTVKLLSIVLTWFLTSSNRHIRDRSTKALVSLLEKRPRLWGGYLKHFNDVDDPYVIERVYCVVYGCVLRRRHKLKPNALRDVAHTVFDLNFATTPREHILFRDYARQIVEIAYAAGCLENRDIDRARPPYTGNQWTLNARSKEEIESLLKHKDDQGYDPLLPLWLSVMSLGDFARYILGTNSKSFPFVNIPLSDTIPKKLDAHHRFDHEMIQSWIFDRVLSLGWSADLHDSFDRNAGYRSRSETKKVERIGKKYQWIAYHELLALMSDNYHYCDGWQPHPKKQFEGPWQDRVWRRDIDPSIQITATPEYRRNSPVWWKGVRRYDWQIDRSDLDWITATDNLIDPISVFRIKKPKGRKVFLNLSGINVWEQHDYDARKEFGMSSRAVFIKFKSFLVPKQLTSRVMKFFSSPKAHYEEIENPIEWHRLFLGELHSSIPYRKERAERDNEVQRFRGGNGIASKILPTTEEYRWSDQYDCSMKESVNIIVPSAFLMRLVQLKWLGIEGRFSSPLKSLYAFDPSVDESGPSALLVEEAAFRELIAENQLELIWSIHAGKEIYTDGNGEDRPGFFRMLGVVSYDSGKFTKTMTSQFEDWRKSAAVNQ